jgi:hypothetical protein
MTERGPFNAGTPGVRTPTAIRGASGFVAWLESEGWTRVLDRFDSGVVTLEHRDATSHEAARLLVAAWAGKPEFSTTGLPAWKIIPDDPGPVGT